MKALESSFFSTVGTTPDSPAPIEVRCGFHGWSIGHFLTPVMKEGDFSWNDGEKFLVGTREQYLHWLSTTANPNIIWDQGFLPLGMFCVKTQGNVIRCKGISGRSIYCADGSDFYPLLWALEGLPTWDINYEVERTRLGTGVYHTFCKACGVALPHHWVNNEDVDEVEDNFLQKYL